VLARAFSRLDLILRSLVKLRFFLWLRPDLLELGVLDLLHTSPQCFAENRATAIDLAQAGVAPVRGDGR
jgi:hypothetical protein